MKRFAMIVVALMLVLPLVAWAQKPATGGAEPENAPVKVQVLGLSKDRMGISYRVTVLTHKPIRSVDLGVTAYSNEGYINALSLKWPVAGRGQGWGRSYDCVQRIVSKPLVSGDTLSVDRGVLQVTYTDGSTWTSAGKYAGTSR